MNDFPPEGLSPHEAALRFATPDDRDRHERLCAEGCTGLPDPATPGFWAGAPSYPLDTEERRADWRWQIEFHHRVYSELTRAVADGRLRLRGRQYEGGPLVPIDTGGALHHSRAPAPEGSWVIDVDRAVLLRGGRERYWDVIVLPLAPATSGPALTMGAPPSGPSAADIGLSPREAALRYATPAEREKYDRLCAEGCSGYDNPRTQNPGFWRTPDYLRGDDPERRVNWQWQENLRRRCDDELMAALRAGRRTVHARAYAGGPLVVVPSGSLRRFGDPASRPEEDWYLDIDHADVLYQGGVRYIDAVIFSAVAAPPKNAASRPSRAAPFWDLAHRVAIQWLDDEGCPAPNDGGQALLERHIADWLDAHGYQASEATIRRHVGHWIVEHRAALGIQQAKTG